MDDVTYQLDSLIRGVVLPIDPHRVSHSKPSAQSLAKSRQVAGINNRQPPTEKEPSWAGPARTGRTQQRRGRPPFWPAGAQSRIVSWRLSELGGSSEPPRSGLRLWCWHG